MLERDTTDIRVIASMASVFFFFFSERSVQDLELQWKNAVEDSVYALFGRYFEARRRLVSPTKKAERNAVFLKALRDIRHTAEVSCPDAVRTSLAAAFQPMSVYARHECILLSALYSSSALTKPANSKTISGKRGAEQ